MPISLADINNSIEVIEKQFSVFNDAIEIICIPHKTGGRKQACLSFKKGHDEEELSLALGKLFSFWIHESPQDTQSEFLGTIQTYKKTFGGLFRKKVYLNLIAINTDTYESVTDFELDLYRLCWNACHALKISEAHDKKDGQKPLMNKLLIPKQNNLRVLEHNLQADIFAALIYSALSEHNYILELAKTRSLETLVTCENYLPEKYPYLMALDQTKYIYKEFISRKKGGARLLDQAWSAAKLVAKGISQEKYTIWQNFADKTQSMAWRGLSPEIILSITIDGNDDIETKKLGVQISALTGIPPIARSESAGYYNPFKSDQENEQTFSQLTGELFETLLTRAIFENSSLLFLKTAEEQNKKLQKGQFMGWCAHALQESADVFDKCLKTGQLPAQMTRDVFKANLAKVSWDQIRTLGESILSHRRSHKNFSIRDFIDFLGIAYNTQLIKASVIRSARKSQELAPVQNVSNSDKAGFDLEDRFSTKSPPYKETLH
ncbi:MAG: hypothetical protein H6855_02825 [Rhodospirillales bacterium]|nr:hypothetical protein [Rhodospirillales bacterium]MCB9973408.1 hypothetical protein [Rhodospirillales bacterium]MCB9980411.1 hypothetical protein [Rhodospirillales bacterium]